MRQELTSMMQKYPQYVPQYVDYLMISKYVERIADHSTNIAQWVLFVVKMNCPTKLGVKEGGCYKNSRFLWICAYKKVLLKFSQYPIARTATAIP